MNGLEEHVEQFARTPVETLTTIELFALVFVAVVAASYALRTIDKIHRKADGFLTALFKLDGKTKRLPPKE